MIIDRALSKGITLLLALIVSPHSNAQDSSVTELIDFDVSTGFSVPRQITILRSFDRSKNIFYVLPDSVEFLLPANGGGSIGLQVAKGAGGSLTFSIVPRSSQGDFQKAIEEIKQRFPAAVFAYPLPSKAAVQLTTITGGMVLTKDGESSVLTGRQAYTVKLSPVEVRVLLLPDATTSPSATFRASYVIKGVSRDTDGKARVEERVLNVAGVLNGFCAPYPASTITVNTGRTGCAMVRFDRRLVLEIQRLLRVSKDYLGRIDGVFGLQTDDAIRNFQQRNGMYVTGYPTRELLSTIREKQPPT